MSEPPGFVLGVYQDLRRRQFRLGPDDLLALRSALRAGFGLGSDRALVQLCVALWASSPGEAATVRAQFARHLGASWDAGPDPAGSDPPTPPVGGPDGAGPAPEPAPPPVPTPVPPVPAAGGAALPPLPPLAVPSPRVRLPPQYPLDRRAIAQAVRRLRRPEPSGPPVELDVEATVQRRTRTGVATPPVLVPRRRNRAELLLLIDRKGSMAPFHPYLDHVREAILHDGGLARDRVHAAYFHDTPVERADPRLVRRLTGLFPALDPVLPAIRPSLDGLVFTDAELLDPVPLAEVVPPAGRDTAVLLLSDAGAARGRLDPARNLASVALLRALRRRGFPVAWLNPVPRAGWAGSSAAQLARHVPMLPLDRTGLHQAVDVLRGRPFPLECAA